MGDKRIESLVYTGHALRQMYARAINDIDVRAVVQKGEVIASYPEDTPYPSELLLGFPEGRPLHVVLAYNERKRTGYMMTAYPPRPGVMERRLQSEEESMTCLICKQGEAKPGRTTVTMQRGACTVIFKGVPADVCENCGEYYVSESVARDLLRRAEIAVQNGAEVEILAYAA